MKTSTRRITTTIVMLMMLMTAVFVLKPMQANAGVKGLKAQDFTTKLKTAKKKATKVKKGTTTIVGGYSKGYIKFTAPKTKKYTFTFNNLLQEGAAAGKDWNFGYITVMSPYRGKYVFSKRVKTEGGKAYSLWVETTTRAARFPNTTITNVTDLPSRSAKKVKLKKGETIYFYLNIAYVPFHIDVTIK